MTWRTPLRHSVSRPTPPATALVLCALGLEYQAIRLYLCELETRVHQMGTRYEVGRIKGTPWLVAIALTGPGNVGTAALAERSVAAFKPAVLIFSGVAGALKDDLCLGDVVVATRIDAYHGGRATEDFRARPVTWPVSHRLEQVARHTALSGSWTSLLPEEEQIPAPAVHLSPIAAGEVVVASRNSAVYRYLELHYNDAVAIEMESAGLANAAHLNDALPTLVVRGISDMADSRKSSADRSGWQHRAARNAAAFTLSLISSLNPLEFESAAQRTVSDHSQVPALSGTGTPQVQRKELKVDPRCTNFLPRDVALMGRTDEVESIVEAPGSRTPDVLVIDAVAGMAGVGKTALAVHTAYRLMPSYPDAQFFIDLHGFTAGQPPIDPKEALGVLLRMLGFSADELPQELDARSYFWRSQVARMRSVLILDNALNTAQVAPLLPGTPTCRVLITSRRRMTGLDNSRSLSLSCLSQQESVRLIERIVGENRIASDRRSAEEIVELCGRLPLALHIAGSRLREHGGWSLSFFKEKLKAAHSTTAALRAEEKGLAASINLSYSGLPNNCKKMFRHLGLHDGPIFSAMSAAALVGTSLEDADNQLETLFSHSLLEESTDGRYHFHDLLREYAKEMTKRLDSRQDREHSIKRLTSAYIERSTAANSILDPHRPSSRSTSNPDYTNTFISDRDEAMAWFESERLNLLAVVRQAAEQHLDEDLIKLTDSVSAFLNIRGYAPNAVEIHRLARAAAHATHDSRGEMISAENLGTALWEIGDFSSARQEFDIALDLAKDLRDEPATARLLDRIGFTLERTGEYSTAVSCLSESLYMRRKVGDRYGEAKTLNSLGAVHWRLQEYAAAMECFKKALGIRRDISDRYGEVRTLSNIGFTLAQTREFHHAHDYLNEALDLATRLDDRQILSTVYNNLGYLKCLTGSHEEGVKFSEQGLSFARQAGSMYQEARALDALARNYWGEGLPEKALTFFRQARDIFDRLGVPEGREVQREIQRLEHQGLGK
ncbi:tetratricopeptide repeat protein [Streptomyces sp. NPDC057257]|uniref:tetratricopeptide repeat protein n=1 Tax=Streptomyces sp. NPDC057257 TaxID=3346071 RepID=UPI003626C73F